MASNYPPGVSGSEPQITGDSEWERWIETVEVGTMVMADTFDDPVRLEYLGDSLAVIRTGGGVEVSVDVCLINPVPR